MDNKQSVQTQFQGVAHNYATSQVFARGIDLEMIDQVAERLRPRRALDVGTAAGHTAFVLSRHADLVVGLDLTGPMLVRANEDAESRKLGNLAWVQGDVEHLPLASDSFDLVTCRFCGHHFPHPELFIAETARILRPGGQILIADTVAPPDDRFDKWINEIEVIRDPSHAREYRAAQWKSMLVDVGMRTETILDWRLRLDLADWTARMRTPPDKIALLRQRMNEADSDLRSTFELKTPDGGPWSFVLHCAIIRGTLT